MKRYICLLLALVLSLALAGCGEDGANGGTTATTTTTSTTTTTTTTTAPTTTTTTAKPKTYTYSLLEFECAYMLSNHFSTGSEILPFDLLVSYGVYGSNYTKYFTSSSEEYGYTSYYTIPESVVLSTIRKTFAVSDAMFARVKAQGSYSLNGPDSATYQDGYFVYEEVDGWGGPGDYSELISLTDNKDGTLTASFRLFEIDTVVCSYLVDYSYTGTADYTLNKAKAQIQSTNKDFIKSLRVISVQEDLR